MFKLIVNKPDGIQEVIEVGEGGGYFDPSLVVWDERKDGALSATDLSKVGGLIKVNGALVVDQARKKQTDDAVKAAKDLEDQRKAEKAARKLLFNSISNVSDVSGLKNVVQAIIIELGLNKE